MKIPTIQGIIDRRILINYQVDKEAIISFLPEKFSPILIQDKAIAGICLIRLKQIRPKGMPKELGIGSENGAHRIAVTWQENGKTKKGVFIPRRDTSNQLNAIAGGRIFPGVHHLSEFKVKEENGSYHIEFKNEDGTHLNINANETKEWNSTSVFKDIEEASAFFKEGAVGYSPRRINNTFDGLELLTKKWEVAPLKVSNVFSSFFEDATLFPKGSVKFDNAILMKNIEHEWRSVNKM